MTGGVYDRVPRLDDIVDRAKERYLAQLKENGSADDGAGDDRQIGDQYDEPPRIAHKQGDDREKD